MIKLYDRFNARGFHTSLITSFGVDFDAFESIVLPRLRGAGCFHTALLADRGMLAYALQDPSALPAYAGRHYTATGIGAAGVFHPKLILQLGRNGGRLLVTSANMTAPGLAGNLEVAGELEAVSGQAGECAVLAAAWRFLQRLVPSDDPGLGYQLDWMLRRAAWLTDTEPASGPVVLNDGTDAAWLASDQPHGIARQFAALVEERPVKRLTVISPYWDGDLAALKFLIEELKPAETVLLLDVENALFPRHAMHGLRNRTSVYDVGKLKVADGRFVHAKTVIAETATADHVLYGSANCTVAALGDGAAPGINVEACLYRRLAADTVLMELQVTALLAENASVAFEELPEWKIEADLPLVDAMRRSPGRFECQFDRLSWRLPASVPEGSAIELLGSARDTLPLQLEPLNASAGAVRQFRMQGLAEPPVFGRLLYPDGNRSGIAVVTTLDVLRETVREARNRRAEATAVRLASEDAEAELWLLEALNELEAAEIAEPGGEEPSTRRTHSATKETAAEPEYRTLSYEEFIRGRRPRSDGAGIERNSLSGSELSLVRNFLNRILSPEIAMGGAPEDAGMVGLDLGDETGDAEGALEAGAEFLAAPTPTPKVFEEERGKAERAKATRDQIVSAVDQFRQRIGERAEAGQISAHDVLRLRAMLTILAAAGQSAAKIGHAPLQVLALDEKDDGWPKLIGRVLFSFFGGTHPPIRELALSTVYDQLPHDILECWATAFWCCQACLATAASHRKLKQLEGNFRSLTERVYQLTGLSHEELIAARIMAVIDGLSARFSTRLGLTPDRTRDGHQAYIRHISSATQAAQ
jgi:hypothetical protein